GRAAPLRRDACALGGRRAARGTHVAARRVSTTTATRPLDARTARAIATAFRPARWHHNRWHHHYALAKLRTDPLYPGVVDALHGTTAPVLDLGCGIGLLAHVLRAAGVDIPYRGIDNDAPKVERARAAAANAGLRDVAFDVVDLADGPPA